MNQQLLKSRHLVTAAIGVALFVALAQEAMADRQARGNTRTSINHGGNANVNRNANANRNTNINANRNVNVNTNRHVDIDVDNDRFGHPVAAAAVTTAAVATTAAAIGSMTRTLPGGCVPVTAATGVVYQRCGSVYYEPQYQGSSVQYVVVQQPM